MITLVSLEPGGDAGQHDWMGIRSSRSRRSKKGKKCRSRSRSRRSTTKEVCGSFLVRDGLVHLRLKLLRILFRL